jgi:TonB-linked SusC/RagA family outer membrane protein
MHTKYLVFLLFATWLTSQLAYAQPDAKHITGIVKDGADHLVLPGVNVTLKGSTTGTITDNEGRFSLETASDPAILVFSYIGYRTVELKAENNTPFDITLEPDIKQLSQVVVVGYGQQERKTLTSSVTSISPQQISNVPAASTDQLIQGQAPGVLVTANSSVPGTGIFLRVRGSTSINASNDPLYVVDGVFINNKSMQSISTGGQQTSPIADINPADIESIEILKDANATAIYGARGANGVVLITTKHGRYNNKSKVNIGYYYGISRAPKLWPTVTGEEEAILQNETWLNDGGSFDKRPFRPVAEGGFGLPEEQLTVDRVGLIFQDAPTHNLDISTLGGDAKTTYYIGANYFDQEAIVKPDKFNRISFRVNLDHLLTDKVKIGVNTNVVRTDRSMSPNGNVPNGTVNGALYTPTYFPLFNPDGSYARPVFFENPLATINETNFKAIGTRFIGNLFGEYDILPGLRFRTSISVDFNDNKEDNYFNSKLFLGQPNGVATSAFTRNATLINEQILTYSKSWNNRHFLNVTVGNTIQKDRFERTSTTGIGFPSDAFTKIASSATQTGTSLATTSGLFSYLGRVSYGLDNKYMIDVNFRADASSRFGRDHRWGYFPSVGVSWRAGQEEFIKNLNLFSELKFRASYGTTGNQNGIGDFASRGLWNGGNNYLNTSGIAPTQLANPDLRWETTSQMNLGVNFGLLKDRLNMEFNYYSKYTTDLLLQLPVSSKVGFTSIFANAGEMSNKGIELSINGEVVKKSQFSWNSNFTLSTNRNKIEKLPAPILKDRTILQQGYPLYSFFAHKQLGVDPENGEVLFDDLNGDGLATDADLQVIGNAWPDYFGGFTNDFTFLKNFDLKVFVYYSIGNDIWNNTRYRMGHGGSRNGAFALLKEQLGRWQQPGDITEVPRMTTKGNNANIIPNRFLEDGSFVRLRNISLGYQIPKDLLSRIRLSSLRVYVMATNLYTITQYKGVDPEVNTVGSDQNVMGYDQAIAPQPRTFQAGFNLSF